MFKYSGNGIIQAGTIKITPLHPRTKMKTDKDYKIIKFNGIMWKIISTEFHSASSTNFRLTFSVLQCRQ